MAFESLGSKLKGVFDKLTNRGKLNEADIKEAMREVRLALLEADVNFKVARDFVARVSEKANGEAVMQSLTPGQQVIKIVNEELTEMMGGQNVRIAVDSKPPTVILLCGLQGAGKTTFAGKLALMLKKQGKKPLLAACDIHRPAAIDQLKILGRQIDVPVHSEPGSAESIAQSAMDFCEKQMLDTLIVDTAGRTHIDDEMMDEIKGINKALSPIEVLLVVDAMTGQEAVNIATAFNEAMPLTGIILTKLDGDARGGAALSMRAVTGLPIKLCSTGEKLENIEPFHPDRMASRILGMGDMLTLIEKASEAFDMEKAAELKQKLRKNSFNLNDFLDQFEQMDKMGSADELAAMLPGMAGKALQGGELDKKQLARSKAIIQSMTDDERKRPELINASRRRRIAAGSGVQVSDVNRLVREFDNARKMMRMFSGRGGKKRGGMRFPF